MEPLVIDCSAPENVSVAVELEGVEEEVETDCSVPENVNEAVAEASLKAPPVIEVGVTAKLGVPE